MSFKYIKEAPYVNVATMCGIIVHDSDRHGHPACGRWMKRIVYKADPVNCVNCLALRPAASSPQEQPADEPGLPGSDKG